jgi:DNA-directed RNA polymerase specialized sigma subunit
LGRELARARETFVGAHGRAPTRTELADMMKMSKAELRDKEYEIRRSDLTSLSSLAVTDSDGHLELIETIPSHDPENDPEHQAARERRTRSSGVRSSACRRASARSGCCSRSRT